MATMFAIAFAVSLAPAAEPITPTDGPINLLANGLERFYTWTKEIRYEDPKHVYSVTDGVLQISGETWGGLTTKKTYADYHMVVEFKWGERTWAHRKDRSRDSGILVHGYGPDGGYSGTWPASIEAQIIEGGVGDILAVPGKLPDGTVYPISISAEVTKDRDGELVWKKGGEKKTISSGRINWYGRDPDWTDTLGFRGKNDVESPQGKWTRYEVVCNGAKVTLIVNGVTVNEGFDANRQAGKIVIQSEGAEIFVRKWELWPLGKAPRAKSLSRNPKTPTPLNSLGSGASPEDGGGGHGQGSMPEVPVGFSAVVAAEAPLVQHPLMACFDDQGRLFVADSGGVNGNPEELERELPGSISILEDVDNDGRFDKRTLFADKLTLPQGVLWHDGAVYVAAPPFIWRLEDTNGDGEADRREELVGRFGYTGNAASIHGCFVGPAGRIYWCDGRHGYEFRDDNSQVTGKGKAARIFSCKADGSDVRIHCGGGMDNPVEIDFSPEGEMLGTVNLMYGSPRGDCLTHWIHGGVYPRFDQGQMIAEFPRSGELMKEVHNFGHVAVSGMMRYRSGVLDGLFESASDSGLRDNYFVTFFNSHKLVRVALDRSGSTYRAHVNEFLTLPSTDSHPTDVLEDADGSLLLIDTGGWFRIGCPNSQIAKPNILGAIYRIRLDGAAIPDDPWGKQIDWPNETVEQLIDHLGDERFAVRKRAVGGLASHGGSAIPKLITAILDDDRSQAVQRRVVWALARFGTPSAKELIRIALQNADTSVRQAAIYVCGIDRDAKAAQRLCEIIASDVPPLRRQAATALGQIGDAVAVPTLLEALRGKMDRTLEHAIIYALIEIGNPEETARGLANSSPLVRRGALIALDQMSGSPLTRNQVLPLLGSDDFALRKATLMVVAKHTDWADGVESALGDLLSEPLDAERSEVLRGAIVAFCGNENIQELVAAALQSEATGDPVKCVLLDSIGRAGNQPLPAIWISAIDRCLLSPDDTVSRQAVVTASGIESDTFHTPLLAIASDSSRPNDLRVLALSALPPLSTIDGAAFDLLSNQLSEGKAMERLAAARAIGKAKLTPGQLRHTTKLIEGAGPLEFGPLLGAFASADDSALGESLIAAMAASPGCSSISASQIDELFPSFSSQVRNAVAQIVEKSKPQGEEQAARLDSLVQHAPDGRVDHGRQVFQDRRASCVACHRVGEEGARVGPDLTQVGERRSLRDLAEAVLFPSVSIARGFESMTVVTNSGKAHTGMIVRETGDAVHLLTADQQELRIPRDEIEEVAPSALSIMPNGLDQTMSDEELVDLLAYLQSLK